MQITHLRWSDSDQRLTHTGAVLLGSGETTPVNVVAAK